MLPLQSYHGSRSWLEQNTEPGQKPTPTINTMDGGDSMLSSASKGERSEEACRSHKDAERRRRQRINAHLSTLRSLLPNTTRVLNFSSSFTVFRFCLDTQQCAYFFRYLGWKVGVVT